jgi:hypothetical protein
MFYINNLKKLKIFILIYVAFYDILFYFIQSKDIYIYISFD